MRDDVFAIVAGLLFSLSTAALASGQWQAYDDFPAGGGIDATKWATFAKDGAALPIEQSGQAEFNHPGPINPITGDTESRLTVLGPAVSGIRADVELGANVHESYIDLEITACDGSGQAWTLAFELDEGSSASNTALCAWVDGPGGSSCVYQASASPLVSYKLELFIDATGVHFSVNGLPVQSALVVGLVPVECMIVSGTQNVGAVAHLDNVELLPLGGLGAPWRSVSPGLPGVSGTPVLCGSGSLAPLSSGQLFLSEAAPSAVGVLFVSTSSTPTPFKGGVLVPVPSLAEFSVTTSIPPVGTVLLSWAVWPVGIPSGTTIYMQYAILDAQAQFGVALSNALEATTP